MVYQQTKIGGSMGQLILTVAVLFVVYFIGYIIGRKEVIDDIKEMTKELKEKDKNE